MQIPTKEDHDKLVNQVQTLTAMVKQLLENTPVSDGLMTREEAARFCRVTVETLDNWDRSGKLKKYYPGGDSSKTPRYRREEVEAFYKIKNSQFFTDGNNRKPIRKVS